MLDIRLAFMQCGVGCSHNGPAPFLHLEALLALTAHGSSWLGPTRLSWTACVQSPASSPRAAPAASVSGKAAIQSAASDTSTSSTAASPFRPDRGAGPGAAARPASGGTEQPQRTPRGGPAVAGRGAEQPRGGLQGGSGEVMPGQSWEEYAAGLNKSSAPAGASEEPAAGDTRPAASAGRRGADLAAAPLQAGSSAEQGEAAGLPAAEGDAPTRRSLPSVLGKQDRAVPLATQSSAAEHSQASTVAWGPTEERPSKRQHMGEAAAAAEQGPWPVQASGGAAPLQEGSAEDSPAAVRGARHPAPASKAAAAPQGSSAESLSAPTRGRSSASSSGSRTPSRSSLIKRAVAEVNWQSASPTGSPRAFLPQGSSRAGNMSTGQGPGQQGPAWQPQAAKMASAPSEGAAGRPPAAVDLEQVQAGQAWESQAESQAKPQGLPAAARNSQAAEPSPGRASTVSGQEEPAVERQAPEGAAPHGGLSTQGKHSAATASEEPAAAAGLGGAGADSTDGPAFPSTSGGRQDAEQATGAQSGPATAPSAPSPAAADSPSVGTVQPAATSVKESPISRGQQVSGGTADAAGISRGQAASLPTVEGSTPASGSGGDSEQGGLAAHDMRGSSISDPQQEVTSGAGSASAGQAKAAVSPGATTAATTAGTPYTGSVSTLRLGRLVMDDQPSSSSAGAVPASEASVDTQDRLEAGVGPSAVPAAAAEEPGQGRKTHSQVRVDQTHRAVMLLPARHGPNRHSSCC